ncbi:MAG: hypothetical protein WCP14_02615 [bacterium]
MRMPENSNGNIERLKEEALNKWNLSYSGILEARIQEFVKQENKMVKVVDKLQPTETFIVGDEKATLNHRLLGGGVGDIGGTIENSIEADHYRKYAWWRNAFDQGGLEYKMSELSVISLAKEAGVEDSDIFRASTVLSKYRFELGEKTTHEMSEWVMEEIFKILAPKLLPDYRPMIADSALRIIPLTKEAQEARTEDNSAWERSLQTIREASVQLDQIFRDESLRSRQAIGSEEPTLTSQLIQQNTDIQPENANPDW